MVVQWGGDGSFIFPGYVAARRETPRQIPSTEVDLSDRDQFFSIFCPMKMKAV